MNTLSSLLKFIGNQIADLTTRKSTTISGGYISGVWYVFKIGKVVFLQIYNFSSVPAGAFDLGASIPTGYRPPTTVNFTLTRRNATADPIALIVDQNGVVACYKYGNALSGATPYNQLLCWFIN